jgi:hypothetical protein
MFNGKTSEPGFVANGEFHLPEIDGPHNDTGDRIDDYFWERNAQTATFDLILTWVKMLAVNCVKLTHTSYQGFPDVVDQTQSGDEVYLSNAGWSFCAVGYGTSRLIQRTRCRVPGLNSFRL